MTVMNAIAHDAVRAVQGPLLIVDDADDLVWDEHVQIEVGEDLRHGLVLDINRGLAVVEVFERTSGIDPRRTRVLSSGAPLRIRVGEQWLGRTWSGRGEPADGGPPVLTGSLMPVTGRSINPARRALPQEPVFTGVSAIDGLATLVRGQKLPVFSVGGLPHLELAAQIAAQAHAGGAPFRVVVAGMGLAHADAASMRDALAERAARGDLAMFLNTADEPVVERILLPRIALTVAEHLAFDLGQHVLVVMADMTSYCEAVREVAAARREVPGRRGYPGYLYSDLASLYERCGRIRGRPGSLTQIPVLSMPAGDITHPVPDLTGYITEGQIVLSPEMHTAGVYPPFEAMASLSRLMRHGAGPGRTRDDHLDLAAQMYAVLARARDLRELSELIGEAALTDIDRRYLDVAGAAESRFLAQGRTESRSMDETLDAAWEVLRGLPRGELTMLSDAEIAAHRTADAAP